MHSNSTIQLTDITLKNFRCFGAVSISVEQPIVLIEGINGAGKTSLLEALHYACYLRSFRTHSPRDLIGFGNDAFFVRVCFDTSDGIQAVSHEIQVGFAQGKRSVKIDKKAVSSYKELIGYYRVVSVTQDDLVVVQGNPETRRGFIDQALLLYDADSIAHMRDFRHVVDSRNSFLNSGRITEDMYHIWTKQLWEKSRILQMNRKQLLVHLSDEVNSLVDHHFKDDVMIAFHYQSKRMDEHDSFDLFLTKNSNLLQEELRFGRSLFGAHLDDFLITYSNKGSKRFASRGQQKLITLLLKIAQVRLLVQMGHSVIFLLDDFMTDFDPQKSSILLNILKKLPVQLLFTSPEKKSPLDDQLRSWGAQVVSLDDYR